MTEGKDPDAPRPAPRSESSQTPSNVTEVPGARATTETGMKQAASSTQDNAEDEVRPKTNDRFARVFGLVVILIAFGGVGGWAATAPIDGAIMGVGTVTVDSHRKSVEHLEGGIVETIHVRDGDIVERGDLLISLDETQDRAKYLVSHNRYLAQLARAARLQAEMDGADSITFPERLVEAAEVNPRAERAMRNERREFEARRAALEGETSVLKQRIEQLEERVRGMESQRAARLRTIASLEEELASMQRLAEREMVPRSEIRPVERQLAESEGEAGELLASIAGARIEAGQAELEIIQRRREFQREVAAELRDTIGEIDQLEEELQALEDTLRRKQIRAPVSGEIVDLQVHSEQGVIRSGEPVLDIVPAEDALTVEGRINPADIDDVNLGQEADVRFTAFSFRTTPVVTGTVSRVSADRLEDENSDEAYYQIRVSVPEEEMARLGDVHLRAGMPADIMVKTGERTPLQYLAKPLADALARSWKEN